MKPIQKKALAAAVVTAFGVGSAEAVFQNPNGTGQVLIYPYYTVQQVGGKSMNTLITVVNTTSRAKVAKVRFREGQASREVLDFNLYLSPNDVWTAAVVPADATTSSPGRLLSFDKSCTNPAIPATGVDFRNFAYAGAFGDGLSEGLARSREGYIEILELATLAGSVATAVTHNSLGVPNNCAAVRTANGAIPDPFENGNQSAVPTGGLSGTGTIINVAQGSDIGYNAVALADCFKAKQAPALGTESNTLAQCDARSMVAMTVADDSSANTRGNQVPLAIASTHAVGVDAVSATLMAESVVNEYILDAATGSNTDWVVTFPTRHFYHFPATLELLSAFDALEEAVTFRPFTALFTSSGLCEPITLNYFNREEAGAVAAGSDFSPQPVRAGSSICWEANVVSFRSGLAHHPSGTTSAVLGSRNITPVTVGTFENGWVEVKFTGSSDNTTTYPAYLPTDTSTTMDYLGQTSSPSGLSFAGLPVVGFMARSFANTQAGTCDVVPCNYNASFGHKFKTRLSTATNPPFGRTFFGPIID